MRHRVVNGGTQTVRGRRHRAAGERNQDACFALWATEDAYTAGVFDGHGNGGEELATVAADTMRVALTRRLQSRVPAALDTMVSAAFSDGARAVAQHRAANVAGTTATLVCVRAEVCVIAHAGDSLATLLYYSPSVMRPRRLQSRFFTVPHRPGFSDIEDDRAIAAGAIYNNGYVLDRVTRSKVRSRPPARPVLPS